MPAPLAARPQIKPGLRRVWRDAETLQIGLTPDVGVIVAGLQQGDARLIEQLDGTHRLPQLIAGAAANGVDAPRVHRLLDLLGAAGVLAGPPTDRAYLHRLGRPGRDRLRPDALAWSVVYADAGDGFQLLAERARHDVLVVGRGRLAAAVQAAVARTGAQVSAAAAIVADREPPAPYALVLLVGEDAVGTTAGAGLLGTHQPHLAVVASADRATVGPLVIPGRSACLRCLELYRTDRDPAWPAVLAQLDVPPAAPRGEASLTELVAALAALQVACWLDARRTPASRGATLTVTLPDGLSTRRPWSMHPRCGYGWVSASFPPIDSGGQATMTP